jgi:hypothetical protein
MPRPLCQGILCTQTLPLFSNSMALLWIVGHRHMPGQLAQHAVHADRAIDGPVWSSAFTRIKTVRPAFGIPM